MSFRFEKLTTKAQEAVANAQSLAGSKGNPEIGVLHLLSSMLGESDGIVRPVLEKIGAPVDQLAQMVNSELGPVAVFVGGKCSECQSRPAEGS